jgi:branched-chain amino acid transport system substrate-binding protein
VLAGVAFRVLVKAIEATGSTNADKVSEYLKTGLNGFPGFTGKISFDFKGDRIGEVFRVYRIDGNGNSVLQR